MAETLTRRVVKATTLLGSTQGINMVCSVARMKLLAWLVGPVGVGLVGVLMQCIDTIGRLTQLNIRTSAVRDLAAASPAERRNIRYSVTRYGRLLGVAGTLLMFVLAPWLAQITFGNLTYVWAFRIASASLLFQALQGTQHIVLQADSRYKAVAASGAFTAVAGLVITVPLYIFLRIDGIAPSIVAYTVAGWLGAMYFTRRDRLKGMAPTWKESLRAGRGFLKVGVLLTVTSLATDLISLGFMAFLQHADDDTLGIYQAGYTMLWRYTGIFFLAYGMEFYPRVSRNIHSPMRIKTLVSHQAIVSTAMLLPCVFVVIPLTPWLLRLLFSGDFLPATPYVTWGLAGMMCRPLSLAVSYTFLSANRGTVYCLTEVVSAAVGLGCNVAGFHLWGFAGLGLSTVVWCVADLLIVLAGARLCAMPAPAPRALAATAASVAAALALSFVLIG